MRLQCQDSSASTRKVLLCPISCISLEWRKSEVRPGLPGMLYSACQQDSSSPPSQSLQFFGQQGVQEPLQEHNCSWVQFGPWFTPELSQGAWVLELLILHGGNPKCNLVQLGAWLAPSRCVTLHPLWRGRPGVYRGTWAREWAVWETSSKCNVGVSPAPECSYGINHRSMWSKSRVGWDAFSESVMAQGSVVRSCLCYQSAVTVLALSQGSWNWVMASEQDSSQPLTFWQQLASQLKL